MKIQKLRRAKGWTRIDLAKKSGVKPKTLERIEQGGSTEYKQLEWIAGALRELGYSDLKTEDLIQSETYEESLPKPKRSPRPTEFEFVEVWIDESLYATPEEAQYQIGLVAYEYLKRGKVVQIRFSSIVITYELPRSDALRLVQAVSRSWLREFGVFDARIVSSPTRRWEPVPARPDPDVMSAAFARIVELNAKGQAGNERDLEHEWSILLEHLRPLVELRARNSGLNYSDAEEITSLVYMDLLRVRKPPLDLTRHLFPWLNTVVRHRILDYIHARNRPNRDIRQLRIEAEPALENIASRESEQFPPENASELTELLRAFTEQLTRPDEQRVWLAFIAGIQGDPRPTYSELAVELGVTRSYVQEGLSRLRKRFRAFLSEKGYSPPW